MTHAPILRGSRAIAMHLRKRMHECSIDAPWIVQSLGAVATSYAPGGRKTWQFNIQVTNIDNGHVRQGRVLVFDDKSIEIEGGWEDDAADVIQEVVCSCLLAEGIDCDVSMG